MQILFVVPYVPNLVRVRPYNLIRTLVAEGHSVTVATLWSHEDECDDIERLIAGGVTKVIAHQLTQTRAIWNGLRAIPSSHPLQANYCWHPGLTTSITKELQTKHYDVVHVEHLRGAVFGLRAQAALRASGCNIPVVWDSVDSISHLFAQASEQSISRKGRLMTRIELGRTRRHEARLAGAFDRVLVTSPLDRDVFINLCGNAEDISHRIAVLPNGVDTEYFRYDRREVHEPTLVISGKMSYHANITMAVHLVNEIMPLVWAVRPDVRVWIVGKSPSAEIQSLGQHMPGYALKPPYAEPTPRVVVTGTVPDMRTFFRQATIAVAPVIYGAGIQNKVLEAMSCGLPVISSPLAVSAINVESGRDLLVAHDEYDFANQILALLNNPVERLRLGQNGREFVERHHSWLATGRKLIDNYRCDANFQFPEDTPCHRPV